MSALTQLIRREITGAWQGGGGPLMACGFLACAAVLPPLASDAGPGALVEAALPITWLALALASLLSLERLFERDLDDGSLDLLSLGPAPLEAVVLIKALAHFLANGAPLALAAPVCAVSLGAPAGAAPMILLAALIAGLGFTLTGTLGAALALGARRGGLLIAVTVLPLLIPPLIFGAAATAQAAGGGDFGPALILLIAYTLFALALTPLAGAAAVRAAQG
ncbi:heme exporter protein CcmB [Brevundimonas sp. 2R-24]|uniref:Heme exporter protein B n=1 Tax=Peiella sedimenti TaxID=3061083 RepID=A0ABT8SK67_9CAUL|nr:heme exporter protein CcmB [Caulobacteraceae bacterium XZ-24]